MFASASAKRGKRLVCAVATRIRQSCASSLAVLILVLSLAAAPVAAGPLEDADAAYRRGDYATALRLWRPLADQGNADAQNNVGAMYAKGQGVVQDYAEAVKWYGKAADQGSAEAQLSLGVMYVNGQGVVRNFTEAVKWYRKAADQGLGAAQNNLGAMYYKGQGVAQSFTEAVKWFRKAAEQGNADAQSALGGIYAVGQGVPQNYSEAVKWLRKAAEQGNARAQKNLGAMYANGQGVRQDYAETAKWNREAADQGDEEAKANLAELYARFPALREQQNIDTTAVPAAPSRVPAQQSTGHSDPNAKATVPALVFTEEAKKEKCLSCVPNLFPIAVRAAQDAGRVYCARSTNVACMMYKGAAIQCPSYILELQGIFLTLHALKVQGMTPGQAATQVYLGELSHTSMPHSFLASVIKGAAQVPQGEETHFAWDVFSACLKAADQ
jgi:TPR repeat protein